MTTATINNIKLSVFDANETAHRLCGIFGWKIKWSEKTKNNKESIHVGNESSMLSIFSLGKTTKAECRVNNSQPGVNHIGILVDNLAEVENRINALGYKTYAYENNAHGSRFFFLDSNNIEFEVICHQKDSDEWMRSMMKQLSKMSEYGAIIK